MYCKNCGKPITSIATECPYCHEKVIENNPNPNNNGMYNNQNPYNNKQNNSSFGNIIANIIMAIGIIFIIIAFLGLIDTYNDWGSLTPSEIKERFE